MVETAAGVVYDDVYDDAAGLLTDSRAYALGSGPEAATANDGEEYDAVMAGLEAGVVSEASEPEAPER